MTDWIQRWKDGSTGWHQDQVNSKLIEFIDWLNLKAGDSVFVPLCGKSHDMVYFLEQGYKIIGVELSALAVEQFFHENNLDYSVSQTRYFKIYQGENITIYCGDYFLLDKLILASVSVVYDRASLIALPVNLRAKYVQHLCSNISKDCRVLLITLNYPQSQMNGPPYAVAKDEVISLFKGFEYQQLQCFDDIENEPKFQRSGVDIIEETTYYLRRAGE